MGGAQGWDMPKVALLTTAEVAERLRVHVRTVHRWAEAGRITPAVKAPGIRGALMFDPAEVERVVHAATEGNPDQ